MKKIIIVLSLVISIFTAACSSDTIHESTHNFNNMTWLRFEPEVFDITVKNSEDCYDIYVTIKLNPEAIRSDKLPLIFELYDPDGTQRHFMSTLHIKSKDGKILGEKIGDLYEYTER